MLHIVPCNDSKHWEIRKGPETGQLPLGSVGTVTLSKGSFQINYGGRHSQCSTFDSAMAWLESTSHEKVAIYAM